MKKRLYTYDKLIDNILFDSCRYVSKLFYSYTISYYVSKLIKIPIFSISFTYIVYNCSCYNRISEIIVTIYLDIE